MTNSIARRDRDILDTLRERDSAPAPRATKRVKRYVIAYSLADGTRKTSRKIYPRALAVKLATRLNRRAHADAYASPITVEVVS